MWTDLHQRGAGPRVLAGWADSPAAWATVETYQRVLDRDPDHTDARSGLHGLLVCMGMDLHFASQSDAASPEERDRWARQAEVLLRASIEHGHQVLEAIRKIEKDKGYVEIDKVKVIMVSALGDYKNIMDAYSEQCDAYVQKPIGRRDFLGEVARLGLIKLEKEDIS